MAGKFDFMIIFLSTKKLRLQWLLQVFANVHGNSLLHCFFNLLLISYVEYKIKYLNGVCFAIHKYSTHTLT